MQQPRLPFEGSEAATPRPMRADGRVTGRERAVTRNAAPSPYRQGNADSADAPSGDAEHAPMLLTVRDVESQLQLGRTRTYQLLRSGEIPTVRVGERALRVTREDLCRWIASKRK